ncbi:MAG: hypothetical protein II077_05315, partial [Treponema sp.]|nr:hypothetical protein [Treponema sp.]
GKLPFSEGDLVAVDIVKEYGKDQVFYRVSDLAAGKPERPVRPHPRHSRHLGILAIEFFLKIP